MDILNLNKKIILIINATFFLFFSCGEDKDLDCTYVNLRTSIIIDDFQPNDTEIKNTYLLIYTNDGFKNKTDSIIPNSIFNLHKRNKGDYFKNRVEFNFDDTTLNTKHNYILVTNNKTKYMISDYTFKQEYRGMMFKVGKECVVDSIKVNNDYNNINGAALWFSKNLGVPLK